MESNIVERKIQCEGSENAWIWCYMEGNNASGGTIADIQVTGSRNYFSGKSVHSQVISDSAGDNTYFTDYYKKIAGGYAGQIQTINTSGTHDITAVDTVYVDTTAGNVTVRLLPPADSYLWSGLDVTVVKTSSDANTVTVYPLPSGPSIDVLSAPGASGTYANDGTTWREVSNNKVRSYTAASTACTGAITTAAIWKISRSGNVVTLTLPALLGTGVATTNFAFGVVIPVEFRPTANAGFVTAPIVNNAAAQSAPGLIFVTTTGVISVFLNGTATGNFTAGVNAGLGYQTSVSWVV
jgi:hypothetical protein